MSNFDFEKDYILENDYVRLSPLQEEHIDKLLQISQEKDIWKYSFIKGDGLHNLTNYIKSTIQNRTDNKEYPFVVFDKVHNEYAGSTRLYDFIIPFDTTRIGYTWYGSKYRGTLLNKNVKYLLFEFLFESKQFNRIGLGAYIENETSINAMRSVGCKQEGIVRELLPSPTSEKHKSDAIMFSILKSDWTTTVKEKLKIKASTQQGVKCNYYGIG